tara:strand:+ start:3970 stop:5196 length:1227 start_codon:yes stop_codon:yes gene_type:complete
MKLVLYKWARFYLVALALLLASLTNVSAEDQLRPAVGKPLQEAQKLMAAGKNKAALSPIEAAESVGQLSAYEQFIINQMKASALSAAGDTAGAVRAFEKVLASGRLSSQETLKTTEAIASIYLRAKQYPEAIRWLHKYKAQGGAKPSTLAFLPQAYYLAGDYKRSAEESAAQIASLEKSKQKPSETQLKLFAASLAKINDMMGYSQALERLVRYYPKPEYWQDVIQRTARKPGFSRNLELDKLRLLRATGNLDQARDYVEMAQLSLQAELPGEAKAIVDEGYEKKVLGQGQERDVERQGRLRKLVDERYAADFKAITESDAEILAAESGDSLVETGLAYVTYGEAVKGLKMMEAGIRKGGLRFPDQAQLRLGYAYYYAGDKAKAKAAFAKVAGKDGARDLARLWRQVP